MFAGSLGFDVSQGVVVVLNTDLDRTNGREVWVQTPSPTGALRIVSVEGARLTLHSTQGERYIFDVQEQRFIDPDE